MLFQIQATFTETSNNPGETWTCTKALPTFFFDPCIQGIIGPNHAARIAKAMIESINPNVTISIVVETIEG